jgi:hypothetical protein
VGEGNVISTKDLQTGGHLHPEQGGGKKQPPPDKKKAKGKR